MSIIKSIPVAIQGMTFPTPCFSVKELSPLLNNKKTTGVLLLKDVAFPCIGLQLDGQNLGKLLTMYPESQGMTWEFLAS